MAGIGGVLVQFLFALHSSKATAYLRILWLFVVRSMLGSLGGSMCVENDMKFAIEKGCDLTRFKKIPKKMIGQR